MKLREAFDKDLPEILAVLKASLGEVSSKKNEEIWRYKHIENPFGKSLVLVAVEDNKIIGVRAFMRWQWQKGEKQFEAFRAVDTATHPDYQGRGVFKKLTLKALELGVNEKVHLIFNTPNSQSKPGYLKMGWKEIQQLTINLKVVYPWFWKFNEKNSSIKPGVFNKEEMKRLCASYNKRLIKEGKIFTPKSYEYLRWRYLINPIQNYFAVIKNNFYLAGYIKHHSIVKELRIVEQVCIDEEGFHAANKQIEKWSKNYGVQVISKGTDEKASYGIFSLKKNIGPVLTIKDLNLTTGQYENFIKLENWNYSLGDLELF